MYCSKCGVQNSDGAAQCANCGAVLIDEPQQVAQGIPIMPFEPKTCGLAIASLVMGILSLFCSLFMAIPAIICGIIALVKISKSQGQLKGNGLAIAGIVVPAVVMFLILPIMLAILMPAMGKARGTAKRVVCLSNMRQLAIATILYSEESDGLFPPTENWCDLMMPYVGESDDLQMQNAGILPSIFQCPEAEGVMCAYAMNENLSDFRQTGLSNVSQIVILFEADLGRNGVGGMDDVALRHDQHRQSGCNIAFVDGHTEFVTEDRIADLQWTVE